MPFKDPTDPRSIESARKSRREHYLRNREQYRKNNLIKRERLRKYISDIKNVPCGDCGVKYPSYVMDLDHRDRVLKIGGIYKFINRQSWQKLKEEIEKCDVVCANCHRERTAKQLGYREYASLWEDTDLQNQ